ncbi:MAG: hypothetical protein JWQ40_1266 [Segetibacter sp.]|jgi:DUF1365 family protein|nr:hypothetical protein [Segetibacter sp.]
MNQTAFKALSLIGSFINQGSLLVKKLAEAKVIAVIRWRIIKLYKRKVVLYYGLENSPVNFGTTNS